MKIPSSLKQNSCLKVKCVKHLPLGFHSEILSSVKRNLNLHDLPLITSRFRIFLKQNCSLGHSSRFRVFSQVQQNILFKFRWLAADSFHIPCLLHRKHASQKSCHIPRVNFLCVFLRYNSSWVHESVWIHKGCCQSLSSRWKKPCLGGTIRKFQS